MERAGLYRRALAPTMLLVGLVGVGTAAGAAYSMAKSLASFCLFWGVACFLSMLSAIVIARQQALRASEKLLTAPARRIASSVAAPYFVAAVITFFLVRTEGYVYGWEAMTNQSSVLIGTWLLLHGCALNSAGVFISRGVRLLGVAFLLTGSSLFVGPWPLNLCHWVSDPHALMGATFGGFHLVAGIYLYFTEKREPTP